MGDPRGEEEKHGADRARRPRDCDGRVRAGPASIGIRVGEADACKADAGMVPYPDPGGGFESAGMFANADPSTRSDAGSATPGRATNLTAEPTGCPTLRLPGRGRDPRRVRQAVPIGVEGTGARGAEAGARPHRYRRAYWRGGTDPSANRKDGGGKRPVTHGRTGGVENGARNAPTKGRRAGAAARNNHPTNGAAAPRQEPTRSARNRNA